MQTSTGYFIRPDGRLVELAEHQTHMRYAEYLGASVVELLEAGWIRIKSYNGKVCIEHLRPLSTTQLATLSDVLACGNYGEMAYYDGSEAGVQFFSTITRTVRITDLKKLLKKDLANA